ncbi:MAG: hypothetical protein IJ311_02445 [Elusimicrobiaceae bacterium]|nr:hypothetical protein [Elusimicrobiaceae bacterium]
MEKTTKMTKATAFAIALELVENSTLENKEEVAAKISKEIEQLSKKSAGSGKLTKAQEANAVLAEEMLNWMEPGHPYTITELSKNCPAVLGANPQKIRPLLSGLIQSKVVERTEGKGGKPIFTKVVED